MLGLVKERELFRQTLLGSLLLVAGVDSRVAPVNFGFNLNLDVSELPFERDALVALRGHKVPTILGGRAVFFWRRNYVVKPKFLD